MYLPCYIIENSRIEHFPGNGNAGIGYFKITEW